MTARHRWIFALYNGFLLLTLPLIFLAVALRWRRRIFSAGFARWRERWGRGPASNSQENLGVWWWVHAVSLGEVKAIEPFLRRASAAGGARILLSIVTPEGLAWAAEQKLGDQLVAAPFDLPWVVRRVFHRVQPQLLIAVESEFWPNLLREAQRAGARVALINGRISARSARRYHRIRPIVGALWPLVDLFSVRELQDAERFEGLGVPAERLHVTGHLKYDLFSTPAPEPSVPGMPLTIALGSTREGEEILLLPVMTALRMKHPALKVIWAPRHLERVAALEAMLAAEGLTAARKSTLSINGSGLRGVNAKDVVWDTMGDLVDAYRGADIAVIGGSFVGKGGQNPIEPAALQRPVVFGPSMENFKQVAAHLVAEGGARQVALAQLSETLDEMLATPSLRREMGVCAGRAVQAEQGATARTLTLLKTLVHDD